MKEDKEKWKASLPRTLTISGRGDRSLQHWLFLQQKPAKKSHLSREQNRLFSFKFHTRWLMIPDDLKIKTDPKMQLPSRRFQLQCKYWCSASSSSFSSSRVLLMIQVSRDGLQQMQITNRHKVLHDWSTCCEVLTWDDGLFTEGDSDREGNASPITHPH